MLGEFVAHKREELGLSQARLAKLSGHPVSTISGIEHGYNKNPRFEIIIDLCEVLEINLDEMKDVFIKNSDKKVKQKLEP